jgi:NAD(P)-dependent dehydrogenase (short-subunit alcohol dehydrogenase family)
MTHPDGGAGPGGAVVTGAGRGLGREIARALHERRLTVHATDLDAEAASETARLLGPPASSLALDVRDLDACRAAAAAAAGRAGSLAVWVNNAGVLVTGPAWEQDETARRLMLEVNALGTINGTLAALERMRPADAGHVVNVISLAGLVAPPGETVDAASKHAALAFSLGTLSDLRRAGIRGVHISSVCPDGVWTPMLHDKLDDPEAALSFSGQMLMPERVAAEVAKLLDRPRPVTTIPRWRGGMARGFDLFPRLAVRSAGLVVRVGRLKQRRLARRIAAGRRPFC